MDTKVSIGHFGPCLTRHAQLARPRQQSLSNIERHSSQYFHCEIYPR